jgi:AcrR family transcriptional regulator
MNDRSFIIACMNTPSTQIQRRASIVQAALICFIDKGFHATSMRDVAQAAGVSLGNLYNYFTGKEALIAEVASQEQEELVPLLVSLADKAVPSKATIKTFLQAYQALCRQREWAVLSAECLAEIARNPVLAPAFAANYAALQRILADALERGQKHGKFVLAAPALLIAQVLLDAVESAALRHVCMPQEVTPPDVLHGGLLRGLLGV